ncbi:nitroreductase family protein [Deinococcus sp. HMF7620]|uniref:Nitroreductase family protein n=1 Tax=Deinococcus arboris TaxID=2682977 RepID=A0A7C9LN54_9DEIO|nr:MULTISPECIES: nitroreductase family protein [Deinococcus]MBZ9753369.1 nitroreductase family protein [Deinococcus betulae]MVN87837.1 nitroreductase family protein [Deinococcus arboris]
MTATATRALSVQEAIETRRSIRKYVQEPLNQDDLREILRLASLAPSAWNAQTWRFAVVQNPELQAKLQDAAYGQGQVTNAPAVIVVYSDMEDTLNTVEDTAHPGMGEQGRTGQRATFDNVFGSQPVAQRGAWGLSQANIAFGFLMLAARSLGYDTVPMLGFQPDKVKEILGLPEHVQFAGLLPLGKRAEDGFPHHRHSVERITKFY